MTALNLTPIAAAIGGAASAESTARDKWLTAAKAAHKAGVRKAMLEKGTEKTPNAEFDATVFETLRQFIITGISSSKKAQKFSVAHPDAKGDDALKGNALWTVAQIVNLTKEQLRGIDDDMLRTMRRQYMQLVDGTMMGRLRQYLDRIENPDAKREPKTKTNAKAAPEKDAPLLDRVHSMLIEFNATVLTLKDDNGKALPNVLEMYEAGLTLIALIGQHRK